MSVEEIDRSVGGGAGARPDGGNAGELAELLTALDALCAGDFSVRLQPRDGLMGQVVSRLNRSPP